MSLHLQLNNNQQINRLFSVKNIQINPYKKTQSLKVSLKLQLNNENIIKTISVKKKKYYNNYKKYIFKNSH